MSVKELAKTVGISQATYYRYRDWAKVDIKEKIVT
jgi:ACT domain-containing protein